MTTYSVRIPLPRKETFFTRYRLRIQLASSRLTWAEATWRSLYSTVKSQGVEDELPSERSVLVNRPQNGEGMPPKLHRKRHFRQTIDVHTSAIPSPNTLVSCKLCKLQTLALEPYDNQSTV